VLWGISDFGGGVLGRRAPIFGVLLATQSVGFAIASLGLLVQPEPMLAGPDLGLSLLAGGLAAIGVGSLYRGLAVGRMGVVAPVTAVLTATTPAVIGIAWQGFPGPIVFVGFALAIVAVVIVSVVPDDIVGRPAGLGYALVGGLTLGLLGVVLSRIGIQHAFAPLAMMRGLELVLFVTVVVGLRLPWRMPRSTVPLVVLVGLVDVIGNLAFLTAARTGDLSIAAVLSSLYPVITVILAAALLRERITRSHAAGVGLAFVAIALITGNAA
jgi:drug/metabolite transporter (DMT)-like permease